jgi:hypothetical protein
MNIVDGQKFKETAPRMIDSCELRAFEKGWTKLAIMERVGILNL